MTKEEAILTIKNQMVEMCDVECGKEYAGNNPEYDSCYEIMALEMAIESLEKQIPKKVSSGVDRTWGKETIEPVCPSCDYFLPRFQFIGNGKRVAYCEHCGQAIDWNEVE